MLTLENYEYSFKPVRGYWFTWFLIEELKKKSGCFNTTLDLGLTTTFLCIENGLVKINNKSFSIDELMPSEADRVKFVSDKYVFDVVKYTEKGFYKLKATGLDKAPTLEINGIHMHRISGIDPWTDALLKISAAKISRSQVILDTCMGLGYTTIASLRRGASLIYTFEIDEDVVWIAERNPWSRDLEDSRVKIHIGDVTKLITRLPDMYFDRIIHDPPRFTRTTGNLYSLEFYKELYRVLKPRGILFHYTGEPRKHGPPSILKGIKERLEKSGFRVLYFDSKALGFIVVKT